MFDYQTIKLMHPHGDELYLMEEVEHHGPSSHDPERSWLRGTRLFRCTHCPEEVAVSFDQEKPEAGRER
jgi:hypothetical protein